LPSSIDAKGPLMEFTSAGTMVQSIDLQLCNLGWQMMTASSGK